MTAPESWKLSRTAHGEVGEHRSGGLVCVDRVTFRRIQRAANPPRKMEVRIDINSDAATNATLLVSYAVRSARWTPIYDARIDTGGRDRKPSIDLVRRAEIVQPAGRK